eukprot:365079-Chlamydomonas_euryale.AAC.4
MAPEKALGRAPEMAPERAQEKAPERAPGRALETAPARELEKAPGMALGRAPERAPGRALEKALVRAPERAPETAPERAPGRAPETAPARELEKAPEKAPERALGKALVREPERALETALPSRSAANARLDVSRTEAGVGRPQQSGCAGDVRCSHRRARHDGVATAHACAADADARGKQVDAVAAVAREPCHVVVVVGGADGDDAGVVVACGVEGRGVNVAVGVACGRDEQHARVPGGDDLRVERRAVAAAAPGVGRDPGALGPAPAEALRGVRRVATARRRKELAADEADLPAHACNTDTVVADRADCAGAVRAVAVVVVCGRPSRVGDGIVGCADVKVAHQIWVVDVDAAVNHADCHSTAWAQSGKGKREVGLAVVCQQQEGLGVEEEGELGKEAAQEEGVNDPGEGKEEGGKGCIRACPMSMLVCMMACSRDEACNLS